MSKSTGDNRPNALSLGVESPQVNDFLQSMPIAEEVLGSLPELKKEMQLQKAKREKIANDLLTWARGGDSPYDSATGNKESKHKRD